MPIISPAQITSLYRNVANSSPDVGKGSETAGWASGVSPTSVHDVISIQQGIDGASGSPAVLVPSPGKQSFSPESKSTDKKQPQDDPADQAMLRTLQQRDRQVRAHEQAHIAAAGAYATSGASYTYQRGPDGRLYAIGGEVSIDLGGERTPEETLAKMETIRNAALAPADPSATDRMVAAQATIKINQARQQLLSDNNSRSDTVRDDIIPSTAAQQDVPAENAPAGYRRSLMIAAYRTIDDLM